MATKHETFQVGISGSYGGLNLGDEAILQVIVAEISRSLPVEITVFSRNAEDTKVRHAGTRAVAVRELSRDEVLPEIERLDLLIIGGGGILFDAEAATFLREAILAQEVGVPVMMYGIGAGPLKEPPVQKLVRNCLDRAQAITVRERPARRVLEDVGVSQEIRVTADPAFLMQGESLPPDALQREGLDGKHRLVAISVREPGVAAPDLDENHYHALLANAADYMVDRLDADLVFIPMERNVLDMQHSHRVIAQMACAKSATVLKGEYTPGQILSLFDHFSFAVGMRLHFLIFAALRQVPFVALPYADKVMGLLGEMGAAALPLQQVNIGQLIAHIDRSWDMRNDLKASIRAALPVLKERAAENNAVAVELLTRSKLAKKRSRGGAEG